VGSGRTVVVFDVSCILPKAERGNPIGDVLADRDERGAYLISQSPARSPKSRSPELYGGFISFAVDSAYYTCCVDRIPVSGGINFNK